MDEHLTNEIGIIIAEQIKDITPYNPVVYLAVVVLLTAIAIVFGWFYYTEKKAKDKLAAAYLATTKNFAEFYATINAANNLLQTVEQTLQRTDLNQDQRNKMIDQMVDRLEKAIDKNQELGEKLLHRVLTDVLEKKGKKDTE